MKSRNEIVAKEEILEVPEAAMLGLDCFDTDSIETKLILHNCQVFVENQFRNCFWNKLYGIVVVSVVSSVPKMGF